MEEKEQQKLNKAHVDMVDMMRISGHYNEKWVVMNIDGGTSFVGARYVSQQLEYVPGDLVGAILCDSEESAKALAAAFKNEGKWTASSYVMPWDDASMIVAPIG
ncbi:MULTISPECIES: hypothetical protein [Pseudomonas]|uniref:hypothetical protein n=1 Tax=Pseudomonas TaxID=286 RepID=UPI000C87E84F|nr:MULTISPECIES: hypothetical protein [Pseudomonas]PMY44714.1 hypothetical protein C1Y36_12715 [Pseudomonas sp. FW306-2-2C-D06C]PYC31108.1 hypothetical protein DMW99_27155 [Pseudomonas chlororaphis]